MIKKFEVSLLIGLVFTIVISCLGFGAECANIRQKVLRLHILANSNSKEDQDLKIKVRDALLDEGFDVFSQTTNLSQAIEVANSKVSDFEKVAKRVITQNGYDYDVCIEVKDVLFNTRIYEEDFALPAGVYEAVQVKIGKAQGKNWWCVMYPSLCVPSAVDSNKVNEVLSENENDIVSNNQKYQIKFKSVEIYEDIKEAVSSWF